MMVKKIFVLAIFIGCAIHTKAQYYYKDIISNNQLLKEMAILKDQKVKSVKITSLEDDGRPSEGFVIEKSINRNYTQVETFTRSNFTGASLVTSRFTKDGLLIFTSDSSDLSVNTSYYFYDNKRRITSIQSHIHSSDDDFTNEITEEHQYEYDENGTLVKMLKIKNKKDSSTILFSVDERKNISIEKDTKSGSLYYYYYDSKNRLTDVVHLNPQSQKMLPDYVFEYNNAGQISQMTSTEDNGSYYYIWKYIYADGLRIKEKCFSKERRLMGSIEYEYK